jgi:hypothetical protein
MHLVKNRRGEQRDFPHTQAYTIPSQRRQCHTRRVVISLATAHGAGVMLRPVLMPLCFSAAPKPFRSAAPDRATRDRLHTLVMRTITTAVAVPVYENP